MALRVLMISSCFPHPENAALGVWAQLQAETMASTGIDLRVVSPTPYVPRILGRLGVAPWAAFCPRDAQIGTVRVSYPRWLYYYVGPLRKMVQRWPSWAVSIAWPLVKQVILDEVAKHQPDVILANHALDGGEIARRIHMLTGIPYVVAEHDFGEITQCADFPSRHRHYQRVFEEASTVLVGANRMRDDIRRIFPATNVSVLRFGRPAIPKAIAEKPRPDDRKGKLIIFSASGWFERKGVPLLVEAFGRIASSFPDAELRIAGDGPEREKIEAAVKRFDRTNQVRLLGRLTHDQILQEMVWSDAFALTGWDEPFGVVYVEAFSAGLPVICCNDCGICDVMEDGVHGFAIPPHDVEAAIRALNQLAGDSELRTKLATNAKALFLSQMTESAYASRMRDQLKAASHECTA